MALNWIMQYKYLHTHIYICSTCRAVCKATLHTATLPLQLPRHMHPKLWHKSSGTEQNLAQYTHAYRTLHCYWHRKKSSKHFLSKYPESNCLHVVTLFYYYLQPQLQIFSHMAINIMYFSSSLNRCLCNLEDV